MDDAHGGGAPPDPSGPHGPGEPSSSPPPKRPRRTPSLTWWARIVGPPLRADRLSHEEITAPEGLAALSLDALTSVAYGPQAMMLVLVAAGSAALGYVLPITVAIVALLAILVLSYRQVIDAYPAGGGAYTVSKENLGMPWARLAGAALIVDYVLTVAVSVAAGVAALTSAFPALTPWTVPLDLVMLAAIAYVNLRGVGDSARVFLLPALVFILGVLTVIVAGLLRPPPHTPAVVLPPLPPVSLYLLLRAFAAGMSAITGVEAIANGVPLFRTPRIRRAKQTEAWLGILLGTMLLGLAVLAVRNHVDPRAAQTVLSQIMTHSLGRSWLYYTVALSVTAVLGLAANTSYGGLPLLLSLLARDNLVPHLFGLRGDRYVFQWGIWVLTVLSAILLAAFRGNTNALIALFAIGVFTGFTLSQAGMVVHWARTQAPRRHLRAAVNGLGAVLTGLATLVFAVAKFTEGAWIVLAAIPALLAAFHAVHTYYTRLADALGLGRTPPPLRVRPTLVVVLVSGVSLATQLALSEARSWSSRVLAVSVVFSDADEHALSQAWQAWNPGVRLVPLRSEYRSVVRPIVRFLETVEDRADADVVVLLPEIVPPHPWQAFLHNHMGVILTRALRDRTDLTVARLPLHVPAEAPRARA